LHQQAKGLPHLSRGTKGWQGEPSACLPLQVIYSLTPLWSALAAWLVLGDEAGPLTWAGGVVILSASLLATTGGSSDDEQLEGKKV